MRLLALLSPLVSLPLLPLLDRLERWMDEPAPEHSAPAPQMEPARPSRSSAAAPGS